MTRAISIVQLDMDKSYALGGEAAAISRSEEGGNSSSVSIDDKGDSGTNGENLSWDLGDSDNTGKGDESDNAPNPHSIEQPGEMTINSTDAIGTSSVSNVDNSGVNVASANIPMTTAVTVSPSATMTISGDLAQQTTAIQGQGAAYRSHTVTVNGNDIDSYELMISYASGSNSLKGDSANATSIGGAGGKLGSAMNDNTWGYAWEYSNNTTAPAKADASMTYKTMPAYGSGATLSGPAVSNHTANFSGKLAFAAKFAANAAPGHYKAQVLLSLIATPRTTATLGDVTYMQDVTADVCNNTDVWTEANPVTYTLVDKRDNKPYAVARIKNRTDDEAHCWMTSNLAFDIKANASKLTKENSDVTESKVTWADDVTLQNGPFADSSGNLLYSTNGAESDKYKPEYGYYYSWCAATAGSCNESIEDQPGVRSASMSICPKGWKIPTGGANGEYYKLLNGMDMASIMATPYNFLVGGFINATGLILGGDYGSYWSSSSLNSGGAYGLYFYNGGFRPGTDVNGRYRGNSVRCVATV